MRTEKIHNNHYITEYVYDPDKKRNYPKRFKITERLFLYITDPMAYCEKFAIPSLKPEDRDEWAPRLRHTYEFLSVPHESGIDYMGLDRFVNVMLDGTPSDRADYPVSRAECKAIQAWLFENYEENNQRYQRWYRHAPKLAWNWVNAMLRREGAPDDITPKNLGLGKPE